MHPTSRGLSTRFVIPFHVERGQGGLAHLFHGNLIEPVSPTATAQPSAESNADCFAFHRRRALQLAAIGGASLFLPARRSEAQLGFLLTAALPWFVAGATWLATSVLGAVVSYTVQQVLDQQLYGNFRAGSSDPAMRVHNTYTDAVRIERKVIPGVTVRRHKAYDLSLGYDSEPGFFPHSHNSAEMYSSYLLEHHAQHPGVPAELTLEAYLKLAEKGRYYSLHSRSREKPQFTPALERSLNFANYRTFKDKSEYVKPEDVEYLGNFKNYKQEEYTGFSVKRDGKRIILAHFED